MKKKKEERGVAPPSFLAVSLRRRKEKGGGKKKKRERRADGLIPKLSSRKKRKGAGNEPFALVLIVNVFRASGEGGKRRKKGRKEGRQNGAIQRPSSPEKRGGEKKRGEGVVPCHRCAGALVVPPRKEKGREGGGKGRVKRGSSFPATNPEGKDREKDVEPFYPFPIPYGRGE